MGSNLSHTRSTYKFKDSDNETLKKFLEVIELQNAKILEDYYASKKDGPDQDAELVGEILSNDFVEVDE